MSLRHVFPGGKRIIKTLAATAGNVDSSLSPGMKKRWLFLRGRFSLTTDATVANRAFYFYVQDGANNIESICFSPAITASQSKHVSIGGVRLLDGFAKIDLGYLGIKPILLEDDDEILIVISNGVAGDSYSGFYQVLEVPT